MYVRTKLVWRTITFNCYLDDTKMCVRIIYVLMYFCKWTLIIWINKSIFTHPLCNQIKTLIIASFCDSEQHASLWLDSNQCVSLLLDSDQRTSLRRWSSALTLTLVRLHLLNATKDKFVHLVNALWKVNPLSPNQRRSHLNIHVSFDPSQISCWKISFDLSIHSNVMKSSDAYIL